MHFDQVGEHVSDTEVDVVITTDENEVTTETGTRHTFRENFDSNLYVLIVKARFGGGSGLNGEFIVNADGGTTSENTEDLTMTDGEITARAVTEVLTTGNGYHFTMSAKGNGFSFSTTAGNKETYEQFPTRVGWYNRVSELSVDSRNDASLCPNICSLCIYC